MKFVFLLFLILIFAACNEQRKNTATKKRPATQLWGKKENIQEEGADVILFNRTDVEVSYLESSAIRSVIAGTIEFIAEEGKAFKKGDLLAQLDNKEAFEKLTAQKNAFILAFKSYSPNASRPEEAAAWSEFEAQLSPYRLFPGLPQISNPDNRDRELISLYQQVIDLETQMKSHFILAERDGIIVSREIAKGKRVKSGQLLLVTAKNKRRFFKLPANFEYSGKFELVSKSIDKRYPLVISGKKQSVEVSAEVPAGDYYLDYKIDQ